LTVTYRPNGERPVQALNDVNLEVQPAEVVGVMGESGSGKSTLALSLLRMLPLHACYDIGSVVFQGRDLLTLNETELRRIRGAKISLIAQDPALALNPVMRVGDQITEVIRAHTSIRPPERRNLVEDLLREVGFEEPREIYSAYPHQLSGGQRQRVTIAQAIACNPALVVADEPTSKLDAAIRAEIIRLMAEIRRRHRTAFLVISHDPTIFPEFADRIAVMYAGRVVEEGKTKDIFRKPLHPYTQALVNLSTSCFADPAASRARFPALQGESPDLARLPRGCSFEPRCHERMEVCTSRDPQGFIPMPSRRVNCFKYGN
jgi:oligopeptide/dipeptide ABC transporter ATP-binding protein